MDLLNGNNLKKKLILPRNAVEFSEINHSTTHLLFWVNLYIVYQMTGPDGVRPFCEMMKKESSSFLGNFFFKVTIFYDSYIEFCEFVLRFKSVHWIP